MAMDGIANDTVKYRVVGLLSLYGGGVFKVKMVLSASVLSFPTTSEVKESF